MSDEENHNKSKKPTLAMLESPDWEIENAFLESVVLAWVMGPEIIPGSPCLLVPGKKHRVTLSGGDAFHYQLVAFARFGREILGLVKSRKKRGSLTISHICGTTHCCEADHLLLEPKCINDERTHCHWAVLRICSGSDNNPDLIRAAVRGMKALCPHFPTCMTRLKGYPLSDVFLPYIVHRKINSI